jgi:predicted PurR-regulated permease PerM
MVQNLVKRLIILIAIFVIILTTIYFLTDYLTKKIFSSVQEINNLIIEKETRLEKEKETIKIRSTISQLEKKYNFNFENLKEELNKDQSAINQEILSFASSNQIDISLSDSKIILNDKADLNNFLKLINFLKNKKIEINQLTGKLENNQLKFEIELK